MLFPYHLTVEEKEYVKGLKRKMGEARTKEEREKMEKRLHAFLERLFLEHKLRRRGEL